VPILVFLGLSVLELGSMYATYVRPNVHDRQTDVRQKHRLMPLPIRGWGIIKKVIKVRIHNAMIYGRFSW